MGEGVTMLVMAAAAAGGTEGVAAAPGQNTGIEGEVVVVGNTTEAIHPMTEGAPHHPLIMMVPILTTVVVGVMDPPLHLQGTREGGGVVVVAMMTIGGAVHPPRLVTTTMAIIEIRVVVVVEGGGEEEVGVLSDTAAAMWGGEAGMVT